MESMTEKRVDPLKSGRVTRCNYVLYDVLYYSTPTIFRTYSLEYRPENERRDDIKSYSKINTRAEQGL